MLILFVVACWVCCWLSGQVQASSMSYSVIALPFGSTSCVNALSYPTTTLTTCGTGTVAQPAHVSIYDRGGWEIFKTTSSYSYFVNCTERTPSLYFATGAECDTLTTKASSNSNGPWCVVTSTSILALGCPSQFVFPNGRSDISISRSLVASSSRPSHSPTKKPSHSPTKKLTTSPTAVTCRPEPGLVLKRVCIARNKVGCGLLKWTEGCTPQGQLSTTYGECQCLGFCGYTCRPACTLDGECYWNLQMKTCFSRATNQKGKPITNCLWSLRCTGSS